MATPLTPYQKRLFVFLSVATFFEGYDFLALSQILPNMRAEFGLSKAGAGALFAFVNAGTVVAWLLVRKADHWGRRATLMATIVGYTICTFLTGLAGNVWLFALFQFLARIFLIGEWAISMVYAAEEYPADRRGSVIGIIQAFSSLGSILCAGLVPVLLAINVPSAQLGFLQLGGGWRTVYFVGIIPLVILIYARRNLRETRRFEQHQAEQLPRKSVFAIWRTPYRKRVLQLAPIWLLTYACTQVAISFWKDFAVTDRGLTDGDVALTLTVASVASLPLVFASGKLIDVLGRRKGAVLIYLVTSAGVFGSYYFHSVGALRLSMVGAIFGVSAVLPVLNAYTTELFPTDWRGDAFAWANNLLGRIGYVLAPLIVGFAAEKSSWGAAVRPTAIAPLLALGLILLWMPETKDQELEDTARL